jgi:Protein of unknown function (DUF4199)
MKKIVITFGIIAGIIMGGMLFISIPLFKNGIITFENGGIIGYTSMVLAFALVFVGVRQYREQIGNGAISFGRAFGIGMLITALASVIYVICWELIYFKLAPEYGQTFNDYYLNQIDHSDLSPTEIALQKKETADFIQMYQNPLINSLITLIEPLPVGLLVSLITAFILKKKKLAE